jgi:[protein-PII] uridylyltransferase
MVDILRSAENRTIPSCVYDAIDWIDLEKQFVLNGADISLFTNTLKQADAALNAAFQHGEDIDTLIMGRASVIDYLLREAWRAFDLQSLETLALIAVGGYGRGELHPHSDVDLLFLLAETINDEIHNRLSELIAFLWDIGLPVGHSTRSISECRNEAKKDITIATNLLEARLVAGPKELFKALRQRSSPRKMWSSRHFFSAKLQEQKKRYDKFGNIAYKLEPNVKEGRGGLRDFQMIAWIAKHHWKATSLRDLVTHQCLTAKEYKQLRNGRKHLWRVRFALHMLAGKPEDRLLFDYQPTLASLFGYFNQDHNLAVEQFMQYYFRIIGELERLNEMLLQLFQEIILLGDEPAHFGCLEPRFRDHFQARNGFLEITNEDVFKHYPSGLLEIFLVMQKHPELKGVRACTIRLIREHRHLIDKNFRANPTNRALFMEILKQPMGITHEFRRMHRYGILAAYWPGFAEIVGRMQYDLFHVYTVDEHILNVLRNIRRFSVPEHAHEQPFCHQLLKEVPKLEILYLAALFHDIGKGKGGDHSELGAKEAKIFCEKHGLNGFDISSVVWLVQHHLLMSITAQRMDIGDHRVINDFARKVGSILRLKHLYILTVADICGTNPDMWNSWRDSLLTELYHNTHRVLRRGVYMPILRGEIISETKKTAMQILADTHISRAECEQLWWNEFDDNYFLRYSADEVAWQTQCLIESGPPMGPKVLVRRMTPRGGTEIFVYTDDHKHLFAHIAAVLDQQGLDIVDARIYTSRTGFALDTFLVLDESGGPVTEKYRLKDISNTLVALLSNPQRTPLDVIRRLPRHTKHFRIQTRITFDNEPDSRNTQLELITADQPGLLSKIGKAFIDSDILVDNARITTIGAQAEDLFFITNMNHHPILSTEKQELIRRNILKRLSELPGFSSQHLL